MYKHLLQFFLAAALTASCTSAQTTTADPFPEPIPATADVIRVRAVEFAALPDLEGQAARVMLMIDVPGAGRYFANDMRGPIYTISYDGADVQLYLDINASVWNVNVDSRGNEQGMQSFAFHPQFAQAGAPGFGKFYTWTDTANMAPKPDYVPGEAEGSHHSVLLEWTARDPRAATYDGGMPRELVRLRQPFRNHNLGHLTFNPLSSPSDDDYGLLYMGVADGGSGGDPLNLAQNLKSAFGKIFRIDPFGSNSANGKYGIPASNPFVGNDAALGEIYAYGVRNPQRFGWDSKTGAMYVADIGQNIVEEISPVVAGANLGWNAWEGSYRYISRTEVSLENPRGDSSMIYPIAEWGQADPLLQPQSAATGVIVYRKEAIPQLADLILFGDLPSGEIFYVQADNPPHGMQSAIRRVLLNDSKTFLQIIQAKNTEQGKPPATRADLRFAEGPNGQIFLLNKRDGVIRKLAP